MNNYMRCFSRVVHLFGMQHEIQQPQNWVKLRHLEFQFMSRSLSAVASELSDISIKK